LDPDTTQVYPVATTLFIALQASAPTGLLTAPSQQALAQGLFQRTAFAAIQNSQGVWQVMLAGPADLDAPVLVPAKAPVSHLIIPIYMYHHVSSLPTHDVLDYSLTVTTTDFAAQLNWMQAQGYHTITMTELFDTFYYGKALPPKPMILSFDDGYADIYTYALPLLLAHHYRGVFYIITGMIGGNYVTWNEVRALQQSGMQIASHTVHHVNIGQPPAWTTTQKELQVSQATLEAELQEPIQFFCYPTGEPFHHDSLAEQRTVLQDLYMDGYLGATLDPSTFDSALQNDQLPYELPRIRVSGGETLSEFIGILAATLAADRLRLQRLSA
jgi:peptidoglycan/xylan/chitin deacetylase (PgdA/CDA1 family)